MPLLLSLLVRHGFLRLLVFLVGNIGMWVPKIHLNNEQINDTSAAFFPLSFFNTEWSGLCFIWSYFQELVASVRTGLDLKHGTRTEVVKLSRGDKHSQQKLIGRADSSPHSGKAGANKVTSNSKSASVDLHGSVTEVCSNITSAHPFSLSMERRSGHRGSAVRLDSKTPNRLASSQNQANGGSNVQVSSVGIYRFVSS